jgi:hypothetical protein
VSTTNAAMPSLTQTMLAEHSPIRSLLTDSERIGAIFQINGFTEALVITNDAFVRRAHGVPQHAFLLAATADLARDDRHADLDDEEVILLRVVGNAPLPQEADLKFLRAQAGIDLVVEDLRGTRTREEMIDPFTEARMQTAGITCAILGTFYDDDRPAGPGLAFGSDVDNIYAATRLRVFKPYGRSLQTIVNFMADGREPESRRCFEIGRVRYASTRRRELLAAEVGHPTDVPVEIDITDFVAHKTAVFGMTRKGKSNTNKVLATMTAHHARERGIRIGQLIFDLAGEYANDNDQDKTSLAALGAEHVVRFRLGATESEMAGDPTLRMLALNFYDEKAIAVVWGVVAHFLRGRYPNTQYVDAFINANVVGPENTQTNEDYRQANFARRARMMAYACFLKAGLQPPRGFQYWAPIKAAVRTALIDAEKARGRDLRFLENVPKNKKGDVVCLDAAQLAAVCDAICASEATPEVADWLDTDDNRLTYLIDVLVGRKGGGHKILLPLCDGYHSPAAQADYAPAIYDQLVDGKIVIVDLARGSEGILQFASERILNHLLAEAAERFRKNLPAHLIQIFLEEAHRLFDRDKFKDKAADTDPYVRLAREAGKYRIGMIYSTQQVSSVEPDVLDNTANWIIAHLNSEQEVRLLVGRYEFARFAQQILRSEDPGFIRLKTQSSRYVVPVQVRLFEAGLVAAARAARHVETDPIHAAAAAPDALETTRDGFVRE